MIDKEEAKTLLCLNIIRLKRSLAGFGGKKKKKSRSLVLYICLYVFGFLQALLKANEPVKEELVLTSIAVEVRSYTKEQVQSK